MTLKREYVYGYNGSCSGSRWFVLRSMIFDRKLVRKFEKTHEVERSMSHVIIGCCILKLLDVFLSTTKMLEVFFFRESNNPPIPPKRPKKGRNALHFISETEIVWSPN